ncbi:SH2 domain-containing protein 2A isoform X4 [Centroberyx gerrardi]
MATQLQQPPNQRTPPIKPRGSLKMAKTPQEEGQRNQTVVKRVSPAAFERSQLPCLSQSGHELPCWLHGCTKRREAEELLKGKPQGCFLLRLSESQIGFVLSYRGKDRCRHFIIEEEGSGTYLIAGEESRHGSLQELVSFYTQNPVGPFNEILTSPCNEEFNIPDLFTSRGGPCDSDNLITDAQYARVNKPTRAMRKENKSPYVNVETLPQQQGVTDASVPRDLGYWRLESLHTYEETPHLDQWEQKSHEEIGFYATGRWRDTEANAACTQHHIYSEVNLRGTRGDPAHIAAQSLPSRTGQDANAQ